ncbi:MAG: T9SS type A sorting domain-containing protein [candidate division WOR-3 bacterium]
MLFVFLISQWVLTPIWTGGFSVGIALGEGKNDDTIRAYCVHISSNTIKEFTYSNAWINTGNINLPFYCEKSVIVADGRNDGINRLYVACRYEGIREYTYSGGTWNLTATIPVSGEIFDIDIAKARNDNLNRLYCVTYTGSLYEATYTGSWTINQIGSPGGSLFKVKCGYGRNDNKLRVYVAGSGGFFEYEYLAGICENYKPGIYYPFFKNGKIEFISENSSFSEISIFDISGREIFKNNFKIKKGKNIISLPLKNLKSGSYFIKIKINEKEFSTKIMFL